MPKRFKFRELRKALRNHNIKIVSGGRHQAHIYRETDRQEIPIPYHGENEDVLPCYISDIERIFGIKLRK